MGFPFGFGKIRAILIPKRLGLAGELGVFALDAILAGLIGGVFLIRIIVTIILEYIKLFVKQEISLCIQRNEQLIFRNKGQLLFLLK